MRKRKKKSNVWAWRINLSTSFMPMVASPTVLDKKWTTIKSLAPYASIDRPWRFLVKINNMTLNRRRNEMYCWASVWFTTEPHISSFWLKSIKSKPAHLQWSSSSWSSHINTTSDNHCFHSRITLVLTKRKINDNIGVWIYYIIYLAWLHCCNYPR